MLCRVAASIYWLNRYVERAENVARFVDVNLNLMLDCPNATAQQWQPLLAATGSLQSFQKRYGEATAENVIGFLTLDHHNPYSIVMCLQLAREQARSIRQFISREMWQQINELHLMVTAADSGQSLAELQEFLTKVKLASHLFVGMMDATVSHNEGWHFGQIGRFLERAEQTSGILNAKYSVPLSSTDVGSMNEIGWMALLKSVSAYEMYRRGGRYQITPQKVAEFLILDREFPRSVQFCLQQVEKSLHQITASIDWRHPTERSLDKLCSYLKYLSVDDIIQSGLQEFIEDLQQQIDGAGDKIVETFFSSV